MTRPTSSQHGHELVHFDRFNSSKGWQPERCQYCKRDQPVWWLRFRYVTGRAGRIGMRRVPLCDACARKQISKHKIAEESIKRGEK